MRRTALAVLALLALPVPSASAGGACATGGPSAQAATTTVTIEHTCFGPGAAVVAVGAKVTWRNRSGLAHNISGPGMEYGDLPDGGTYTATFTEPGLYPYACMIHPGMSGVVVVGAAPQVTPAAAATVPPRPADRAGWAVAGVATAVLLAAGVWLGFRGYRSREVMPRWSGAASTDHGLTTS